VRIIVLRHPGSCAICRSPLSPGERAWWDPDHRSTTCRACVPAPANESAQPVDRGTAGASAGREYERRSARHAAEQVRRIAADADWRQRARSSHPVLGRVVTTLTPRPTVQPEPAHVRSWAIGTPGEVRVAQVLDELPDVVALHDRKVPHSRANIDHLAITAAGIWVIDTKRYVDQTISRRDRGGLFHPDPRLLVGGRDRTSLVEAMTRQLEVVTAASSDLLGSAVVRALLCFVDGAWGLLPKPFQVRGVAVCWPGALPGLLGRAGPLTPGQVREIGVVLARRLPSA
jgi:hypothetical protein